MLSAEGANVPHPSTDDNDTEVMLHRSTPTPSGIEMVAASIPSMPNAWCTRFLSLHVPGGCGYLQIVGRFGWLDLEKVLDICILSVACDATVVRYNKYDCPYLAVSCSTVVYASILCPWITDMYDTYAAGQRKGR